MRKLKITLQDWWLLPIKMKNCGKW